MSSFREMSPLTRVREEDSVAGDSSSSDQASVSTTSTHRRLVPLETTSSPSSSASVPPSRGLSSLSPPFSSSPLSSPRPSCPPAASSSLFFRASYSLSAQRPSRTSSTSSSVPSETIPTENNEAVDGGDRGETASLINIPSSTSAVRGGGGSPGESRGPGQSSFFRREGAGGPGTRGEGSGSNSNRGGIGRRGRPDHGGQEGQAFARKIAQWRVETTLILYVVNVAVHSLNGFFFLLKGQRATGTVILLTQTTAWVFSAFLYATDHYYVKALFALLGLAIFVEAKPLSSSSSSSQVAPAFSSSPLSSSVSGRSPAASGLTTGTRPLEGGLESNASSWSPQGGSRRQGTPESSPSSGRPGELTISLEESTLRQNTSSSLSSSTGGGPSDEERRDEHQQHNETSQRVSAPAVFSSISTRSAAQVEESIPLQGNGDGGEGRTEGQGQPSSSRSYWWSAARGEGLWSARQQAQVRHLQNAWVGLTQFPLLYVYSNVVLYGSGERFVTGEEATGLFSPAGFTLPFDVPASPSGFSSLFSSLLRSSAHSRLVSSLSSFLLFVSVFLSCVTVGWIMTDRFLGHLQKAHGGPGRLRAALQDSKLRSLLGLTFCFHVIDLFVRIWTWCLISDDGYAPLNFICCFFLQTLNLALYLTLSSSFLHCFLRGLLSLLVSPLDVFLTEADTPRQVRCSLLILLIRLLDFVVISCFVSLHTMDASLFHLPFIESEDSVTSSMPQDAKRLHAASRLCLLLIALLSALLVAIVALKRKRDAAESQSLRALLASSRAAAVRAQLTIEGGRRPSPVSGRAQSVTIGRTATVTPAS
ncbi:transmembrane protein [Cystoisospora suis]|uniref:Transmembrane protein n=1 Tax=Cystoisospora suis TaxID=483139 RepID=A0A2C6LDD1_9APIC|nr:transmembrane protein [Cystoisospora suis]